MKNTLLARIDVGKVRAMIRGMVDKQIPAILMQVDVPDKDDLW